MWHKNRLFGNVQSVDSALALFQELKDSRDFSIFGGDLEHAVEYKGFLFANDSSGSSPDCWCVYAVFDIARKAYIDSWTIEWLRKKDVTETEVDDLSNNKAMEYFMPSLEIS